MHLAFLFLHLISPLQPTMTMRHGGGTIEQIGMIGKTSDFSVWLNRRTEEACRKKKRVEHSLTESPERFGG